MFSRDHWQFKNGHFNSKRKDVFESALLGPIGTTFAVMAKAKGEGHSAFHTVRRAVSTRRASHASPTSSHHLSKTLRVMIASGVGVLNIKSIMQSF